MSKNHLHNLECHRSYILLVVRCEGRGGSRRLELENDRFHKNTTTVIVDAYFFERKICRGRLVTNVRLPNITRAPYRCFSRDMQFTLTHNIKLMEEGKTIAGVYELVIGTTDADSMIHYWQQFGFHMGKTGRLSAEQALTLYGVHSDLQSVRLHHQTADHGLIRLFIWDIPKNEGLQLSPMKCIGNRWGAALIRDILQIENHIKEARDQNMPLLHIPSTRAEIYPLQSRPRPFLDQYPCVRETFLAQPLTRQVFFQRFGYDLPHYGQVNESSPFRTSQMTHVGIIIEDRRDYLTFYDEVLGFRRSRDEASGTSTSANTSSRLIFDLKDGESYATTDFDDPRFIPGDIQQVRSGRLKVIRFSNQALLENKLNLARPGSLGLCLYTIRVQAIELCHAHVKKSAATQITPITRNEFGENSFSFDAPDGYAWNVMQSEL